MCCLAQKPGAEVLTVLCYIGLFVCYLMEDDLNSFISVSVRCLHTVLMKCAMQHSLDSLKQATLSVVIRAFGDSPYSADLLEGLVNREGAAILDGHDIEEEGVILVLEVHVKEEADGLEVHFEV